jgi:N-acyl-D-aspartate/D-glutamate deacylase
MICGEWRRRRRVARRLVQKADGIATTIVNGTVAFENGEVTGEFAGRVLKARPAAS